jgi:flavin-dependent dehydrogenase
MHDTTNRHVDLFIAGAGPAGLACAIAAASQGLQVEVADGMTPPIDKACGEGLMPDTLAALAQLGIDIDSTERSLLSGIRFISDTVSSEAPFPSGPGRGMRRTHLHQLLLNRATALGVHFRWRTVVQSIQGGRVHTNRHTVHPRWIVGADGHQSRIRRWAGLEKSSSTTPRIGLRQHFAIAPWTDFVEVYWGNHAQAYVTPISPQEVCVAFVAGKKFPSVQQALTLFPALQSHLAATVPNDPTRGSITLSRKLRRVISGNIALIGDASGSVDAITGEGLSLCFRQALALAEALKSGDLRAYQREHKKLHRLPYFMSRTMLLMDRSPVLRTRTLRAFHRRSDFFSEMLKVHIGHAPLRLLGSSGVLPIAASVLIG